jgi:acetyl esterase/lipase
MLMQSIFQKYSDRRHLYPAPPNPPNPPLNTRYIRRKWLNVSYALGSPSALMDIYLPNDGAGPFPVILFIHGGGYFTGDKGDYETYPPLEGLKRGYAVCAINYSLARHALFPRAVQEGKAAIRFIRAHATEYDLDPACLIAWGMSAGANLAALLAVTGHQSFAEFEDKSMGSLGQPVHVDACMVWFCPTAFAETTRHFQELKIKSQHPTSGDAYVLSWYFGLPVEEAPDLAALSNPETFITPQAPPFVIQHGKLDAIVPVTQSISLAQKLSAVIGPEKVRLTLFDDYIHADRRFETMHNCSLVLDQLEELLGRA